MENIIFNTSLLHSTFFKKALLVIGCFLIIIIIKALLFKFLTPNIKDNNNRFKIKRVINFFFYFTFIFILSLIFNEHLQSLTVTIGAIGAGITFALQEVIISVAGWFAINFGNFYKVSDRIQLGGIKGDVIDIGILRTTLMECGAWVDGDLYNGRIVRVANSFVFKEPVFNYSSDFSFLWDEIIIPIQYGSNIEVAKKLIKLCAHKILNEYETRAKSEWQEMNKKYLIETAKIENFISMKFDMNAIFFTLRYITDYKSRRSTKNQLFEEILMQINQNNEVFVAGATLEITNLEVLNKLK